MQDVFYDEMDENDSFEGAQGWIGHALKWGAVALSLSLLVIFGLWAYRLGVRDAREIPVIQALDRPARVQPSDPGGTLMPNQGLEVNEILGGDAAQTPREATLAPATLDLNDEDTPAGDVQAADTAATSSGASEPAAVPDPADEIAALLERALSGDDDDSGSIEALPAVPPLPFVRPRSRPEGLVASSVPTAPAEPTVVAAVPDPAPTAVQGGVLSAENTTRSAAVSPSDADPASLPAGTRLVQLGAYEGNVQAEAQWERLMKAHGDLLGGKSHFVQTRVSNGQTYYRLRVIGMETENDQTFLCEALKARSVDCIPVIVR
ncbi:MAG: SPOR domain-containing protein [Pseudomonadota bacterium]